MQDPVSCILYPVQDTGSKTTSKNASPITSGKLTPTQTPSKVQQASPALDFDKFMQGSSQKNNEAQQKARGEGMDKKEKDQMAA